MRYTLKHLREFYPVNDFFDNVIKDTASQYNESLDDKHKIYINGSGKVNYSSLEFTITDNNSYGLGFLKSNIFSSFDISDIYCYSSVKNIYDHLGSTKNSDLVYSKVLFQLLPTYVIELDQIERIFNNMLKVPNSNEKYYDSGYLHGYYNMIFSDDAFIHYLNNDVVCTSLSPLQLVKLMDQIIYNLMNQFTIKFKEYLNAKSLELYSLQFKDCEYELSKYSGQPYYVFSINNKYKIKYEFFNEIEYEVQKRTKDSNYFVLNIIVFPFLKEMLLIVDDYRRLKSENRNDPIIIYYSTKYDTNVSEEEFDKIIMNLIQNFLNYYESRKDEVLALCKERLDHKDESKNVYEVDVSNIEFALNSKQCILIGNVLVNNLIQFIDSDNEKQFLYYNNLYNTKLSGDPRIITTLSDIPVIKDKFTKSCSSENLTIKKAKQNYNQSISSLKIEMRYAFIKLFRAYCNNFYKNFYDVKETEFNEKILFDEEFNLLLPSIGFIVNNVTDNNIGLTISFRRDFTESRYERTSCYYTLDKQLKNLYWYEKLFDIHISSDILTMRNNIIYNERFYNESTHQLDFEYAANQIYNDMRLYIYKSTFMKSNCIYDYNLNKSNKTTLIKLMLQYLDMIFRSKEFLQDMANIYNEYLQKIKDDSNINKALELVNKNKLILDQIKDLGNSQLNKQLNNILLKDYDDLSVYMLEASFYLSDTINITKVVI